MPETEATTKRKNWFARHKIWSVILALAAIGIISTATNSNKGASSTAASKSSSSAPSSSPVSAVKPAARQVKGKATTLGAGTFTGGTDVAVGLYDVTPGPGQSGNFIVSGTDSYNEVLGVSDGLGVTKVRAQISTGDSIQISSLSQVTFTPVTTPFVTSYATTSLYAGTFIVGQDIAAGRYVATPGPGQSGNFIVSGNDTYNEILGGDSSMGGVPSVTVTLTKGDTISISGMSQVALTPAS